MQEKPSADEDDTMLQLNVTSCTVFTEVFRVLKNTWKERELQPPNFNFLFYFRVPWCDLELTKTAKFIFSHLTHALLNKESKCK